LILSIGHKLTTPFLCIGHEAGVDQVNQPYVVDDSGDHASMIEAFDAKRFHGSILP